MFRVSLAVAFAVLTLTGVGVASAGATPLAVTDLGPVAGTGSFGYAAAVNAAGGVAGGVSSVGTTRANVKAARWQAGKVTVVGSQGTIAQAIDSAGDMFGVYFGPDANYPVRWDASGEHIDMTQPGGEDGGFHGASPSGIAVGRHDVSGSFGGVFIAAPPAYTDSPVGIVGYSVNDLGHIAGRGQFFDGTAVITTNVNSPVHALNRLDDIAGNHLTGPPPRTAVVRHADGSETALPDLPGQPAGDAAAGAINDAGVVVGESGALGAVIWRDGAISTLDSQLPSGSPWHLTQAFDISNSGYVLGRGDLAGVAHYFLAVAGIVVNSVGDDADAKPGDGFCATTNGECTLRAAIQEVNAEAGSGTPVKVTFNIPGVAANTIAMISPASPLPAVTRPVVIDASTQPAAFTAGVRVFGAILDGGGAGAGANGLNLASGAAGSTVQGLQVQHFTGAGVVLAGAHQQLADSLLTADTTGVEVAGNNDTVGSGNGLPGDIFFADGDVPGLAGYLTSLAGQHPSDAALQAGVSAFGGGIVLSKPSSGAQITGDYIGVHGPGFAAAPDQLAPDSPVAASLAGDTTFTPVGVLIAATGGVSNVTIGGSGAAADVISGTIFGVAALAGSGSPISGLSVRGSSFGAATDGTALKPLGGLYGVLAAGAVTGLQIGAAGAGDSFQGLVLGVVLGGQDVAAAVVQGNTFGTNDTLGDFQKGFGLHDAIGLVLADTQGAQIGGSQVGEGNNFVGDAVGLVLAGQHVANDKITGNTFGSTSPASFTTFAKLDYTDLGGGIGAFVSGNATAGASAPAQNVVFQGNAIQGNVLGFLSDNATGISLLGNTAQNNALAVIDGGSGGMQIGDVGQGNAFLNNGIGVIQSNRDPDPSELQQAQVNPADAAPSTRQALLSEPNENVAFDAVNAITTANLTPTSANTSSTPGSNNSMIGNLFGVDASGNPHPNSLPLLIAGDEHGLVFGGTAAGQGNTVADNRAAGVLIGGEGAHNPSVQILGNTIYNNENFTETTITGLPGLGIDLAGTSAPAFGVGVNPQDPTQPDQGPNNLQNSPVVTSATTNTGQLTISGSLHGVASTNYVLEVFADQNQNPFGAGEGQTLLQRISLATDASGDRAFTSAVAAPDASYRFVSATATTVPASGPGVTSEFSVNAPITAATSTPPPVTGTRPPPPAGTKAPPPPGASRTTVTPTGHLVIVSGASVTLPATASCSSAPASPCTVNTTVSTPTTTATTASLTAKTKPKNAKRRKRPLTIGRGTVTLAPGTTRPLHLQLTRRGLALLHSRHTLLIDAAVRISGRGRPTISQTLHFNAKLGKTTNAKGTHKTTTRAAPAAPAPSRWRLIPCCQPFAVLSMG